MPSRYPFRLTKGTILRMLADAALIQLALIAAYHFRWFLVLAQDSPSVDEGRLYLDYIGSYFHVSLRLTPVCLIIFCWNGFYTYGRYYQGRYKALVVSQAVTLSYIVFVFLSHFFWDVLSDYTGSDPSRRVYFPKIAVVLAWFFSVVLLVGARIWSQVWRKAVDPEQETIARIRDGGQRRVLVIGGAGYIGSALLPKLLDRGYYVRVLDLLLFGESPIEKVAGHPNLEVIRGDFRHVENVVEAMRDVESVVHLGGIVGDPACSLDEDLTIDVNLSATRMIAELAKAARVDRFIFSSTCSVYGACDETLDERSQVKPVSLYGNTKLASERILQSMANERFCPTIVRFATIYGLSGRTRFDLVVNLLSAKSKIDGEITVFGGDQWRPFVHVDDSAKAIAMMLDAPRELVGDEIFNVGCNEQNYTIRQIADLVHEQVVSATVTIDEEDVDRRDYRVDFSKIRNLLGFEPEWTVESGIQQVLEAIANGEITDYREPRYSNVKFLTEAGTTTLARDNWARELIQTLTSQQ